MKRHRITDLFNDKLWRLDPSRYPKAYGNIVRFSKLIRITIGTFMKNRMGFQCVALSYFVALAIIPLVALLFAISDGLRLSNKLAEILAGIYPSNPEMANTLMEKANNILDMARSGGVGVVSALFFLGTIFWMLFQVERVFNNVWGILKIPRKIYKRLGFYVMILVLSPFVVLMFGTGIAIYSNFLGMLQLDFPELPALSKALGYLLFYVLTSFTLFLMYKYIPATLVDKKSAFKSALVAAVVFLLFQYMYLETQMFVARLNRVYGVIAAVPLFLIWLNLSWQIVIYGAELSYSYQNIDTYGLDKTGE